MTVKKKPWYIWLSIPAFILLWGDSSRRIMFGKPYYNINDGHKINLGARFWGNTFILWVGHLMILLPIFAMLMSRINRAAPSLSLITEWTTFILAYLLGVYITYKHAIWREKNIPHYLRPSENQDA